MTNNSTNSVLIDNLISISCFLREIRMQRNEFIRYCADGRVEGLIRVAGRYVVDRSKINIRFLKGGSTFREWVMFGGRNGVVQMGINKNPKRIKRGAA